MAYCMRLTTTNTIILKFQMLNKKIINGVDKISLTEIINAVKTSPELAKFQFRAKNTWMNGGHSRSVIKGFSGAQKEDDSRTSPFIFEIDQPLLLLGHNNGPTPIEYILIALGGCLTNSIIYYSTAKGINIEDVELELVGNFDLRYVFGLHAKKENLSDSIQVKIRIKGKDLSDEEIKFLSELGEKTSPVYNLITNSLPVVISTESGYYQD